MKKQYLSKIALAAFCVIMSASAGHAQLGNLKNKVKNAASNVGNNNNSSSGSSSSSTSSSSSSSSSSGSNITVGKDESGYDLAMKGDAEYEKENYKDALAYYEEAEKRGYQDGMVKKRMNECRDNLDPQKQKEDEAKMNKVNQIMGQLENSKYKIDPVTDQGITNDLHKKNLGKIVFAKTEIPKSETSDAAFANSFNLGDNIYSRVYMEKSFTNYGNEIGYISQFTDFKYRMTVAGQTFDILPQTQRDANDPNPNNGYPLSKVAANDSRDTWTTFQIGMSPSAEDASSYPISETNDFFYRMYQLAPGSYTVKLEVVFDIPEDEVRKQYWDSPDEGRKWTTKFGKEKVLAAGEFKINITEAGKIATGKKLCPKFDWINYKLIKVPDGFTMVNKSKRPGETILKVVEIHNDWKYIKNGFGIILRRTIGGKAIAQNDKTKLCYEIDIEFSQENISSGGSQYGSTTFIRTGEFETATVLFLKDCIQ